MKLAATSSSGEQVEINVLIDTGAEVNLVRPGLLRDESFRPAEERLKLITVSGSTLAGGVRTTILEMQLKGVDQTTNIESRHVIGGVFYEAEIDWDAIISFPLLAAAKIGVLPHRRCLLVEKAGGNVHLIGAKTKELQQIRRPTISSSSSKLWVRQLRAHGWHQLYHSPKWHQVPGQAARWSATQTNSEPGHQQRHGKPSIEVRRDIPKKIDSPQDASQKTADRAPQDRRQKKSSWRTCDYAVNPSLVQKILKEFDAGIPEVDVFAAEHNKRFEKYWSEADSAWKHPWDQGHHQLLWMNPPFDQIEKMVDKLRKDRARAIVIVPGWRQSGWWERLQDIVVNQMVIPRGKGVFLREGHDPMPPTSWSVWAFLVDGNILDNEDAACSVEAGIDTWTMSTLPGVGFDQTDDVFKLEPAEVDFVAACVLASSVERTPTIGGHRHRRVRSVVKTLSSEEPPHLQAKIEAGIQMIKNEFNMDVLSGKLPTNPPVRGPFGLAKINLRSDAQPKRQRCFQLVGERADALKKTIDEFKQRGWIEPSFSEWGAPAFVVPKKQKGEWRMVVDYRALNTMTKHDSYGLPLISELLQKQTRRRMFTVLDMKKGYHQMPLDEASRPCTAMTTPSGLWQWKVMPMGAKNGNAAFQRMMDWVLADLDCADPFVDDVIISSEGDTDEELIENHLRDVRAVLTRFREHQLVCDMSKAQLFRREVEFCGHIIGHGKRKPSPGKLTCLEKWTLPKTVTELRSFLGFCNWYHDYVPMFAEIAAPLMSLLKLPRAEAKKGSTAKLNWNKEAMDSFEAMKQVLKTNMELELVDPDIPFILRCDASEYAVGACLEQPREDGSTKPVGFWSRKLTSGQRRGWSPREKETYALVEALKKWAGCIGFQPVVVLTDHQALQSWYQEKIDTPSGPAGRRARWHELLSKFDIEVRYIPGAMNTVADALSRWAYPASKGLQDVSSHGSLEDWKAVKEMEEVERAAVQVIGVQKRRDHEHVDAGINYTIGNDDGTHDAEKRTSTRSFDEEVHVEPVGTRRAPIATDAASSVLAENWSAWYEASKTWKDSWTATSTPNAEWPKDIQLRNGFMFLRRRLCVPEAAAQKLMVEWHEKLGHCGIEKMKTDVSQRFDVPDLMNILHSVCGACQQCQAMKPPNWSKMGRWTSTPTPSRPGASIALDIVSMSAAKTWDGRDVDAALVLVDRHSGWVEAWPIKKKGFTSKMAAHLVHSGWIAVLGCPSEITTDLGSHFAAQWFKTFCGLQGIHHAAAISYRSSSNGRAERAVESVLVELRKLSAAGKTSWPEALSMALGVIRSTPGPTELSPAQVVFGRDALSPGLPLPDEHLAEDAVQFHKRMQEVDAAVRQKLDAVHAAREAEQSAKHREAKYQPKDLVWVLRPRGEDKMASYWTGPHVVVKRTGADTFDIDVGNKIRRCHAAQLKKHIAALEGPSWPLHYQKLTPDDAVAEEDQWIVEKILKHRRRQDGTWEFLTRWEGYGAEGDQWEAASAFLPVVNTIWLDYLKKHNIVVPPSQMVQNSQ